MSKFFISLGSHCFPRRFIDKYKLQERLPIRSPFDGSLHQLDTICYLLENNFLHFCDINYFKIITDSQGNKIIGNFHSMLRSSYNHERSLDLSCFQEQQIKRVKQFREIVYNKNNNIFFIILKEYVPFELIEILDKKCNNYHLFILNKTISEEEENVKIESDTNYTFIDVITSDQSDFEIKCLEIIIKKINLKNPEEQILKHIEHSKLYKVDLYYD